MKCAHCLRGQAQKRNIHKKYITKVLEDISSIGSLTITGFEYSCNQIYFRGIETIRNTCE